MHEQRIIITNNRIPFEDKTNELFAEGYYVIQDTTYMVQTYGDSMRLAIILAEGGKKQLMMTGRDLKSFSEEINVYLNSGYYVVPKTLLVVGGDIMGIPSEIYSITVGKD